MGVLQVYIGVWGSFAIGGIWWHEFVNKLVEWGMFIDLKGEFLLEIFAAFCVLAWERVLSCGKRIVGIQSFQGHSWVAFYPHWVFICPILKKISGKLITSPKWVTPGDHPRRPMDNQWRKWLRLEYYFGFARVHENAKTIASIFSVTRSQLSNGWKSRFRRQTEISFFVAINQIQHRVKQLLLLVPPSYYVREINECW